MNKPIRAVLIGQADTDYKKLNEIVGQQINEGKQNSHEIQLLRAIKQKVDIIKANPFYGDNIPKKLIPREYNVQNLFRVELPNFWRMLYTIKGDQIEIVCFVLDIIDHKEYNKKFGYKTQ